MASPKEYFDLPLETLRVITGWAAGCAERALPIYKAWNPGDPRPQAAIEGAREFAAGGKRTAKLRVLALDAYRASLETGDPAASAAARATSLAAASAYTHPFADVNQAKHILGPAAYAALAVEISHDDNHNSGYTEIRRAVDLARREIVDLLLKMPCQPEGKSRLDILTYDLDMGLRERAGMSSEEMDIIRVAKL
jgi:hypothetical protein